MFWKNTAWSWDDDDGGYLLAADLRRTPDSVPDTDLNHITTTAKTTILSNSTTTITAELKDLTSSLPRSLDPTNASYSSHKSTLSSNTNRTSSTDQRLTVSHGFNMLTHRHHQKDSTFSGGTWDCVPALFDIGHTCLLLELGTCWTWDFFGLTCFDLVWSVVHGLTFDGPFLGQLFWFWLVGQVWNLWEVTCILIKHDLLNLQRGPGCACFFLFLFLTCWVCFNAG